MWAAGTVVGVPGPGAAAAPGIASLGANPSRGDARLALTLPRAGRAVVAVFDVRGARVRRRFLRVLRLARGRDPLRRGLAPAQVDRWHGSSDERL